MRARDGVSAPFEFIFVSSDRSTPEFSDYLKSMPWLAIPPGDPRKAKLSKYFGVSGIPTLVTVDEEGTTISASARDAVGKDPTGQHFPWAPEPCSDLEDGPEGLNDTPSLIALLDGLDAAAQASAVAALTKVALETRAAAKAKGQEAVPLFFYSKGGEGAHITPQVRKLTKQPAACPQGSAAMLLLDIPDDGGYYLAGSSQVTEESIGAFLGAYAAKALERQQLSRG
jgi:nucleoredoxin